MLWVADGLYAYNTETNMVFFMQIVLHLLSIPKMFEKPHTRFSMWYGCQKCELWARKKTKKTRPNCIIATSLPKSFGYWWWPLGRIFSRLASEALKGLETWWLGGKSNWESGHLRVFLFPYSAHWGFSIMNIIEHYCEEQICIADRRAEIYTGFLMPCNVA